MKIPRCQHDFNVSAWRYIDVLPDSIYMLNLNILRYSLGMIFINTSMIRFLMAKDCVNWRIWKHLLNWQKRQLWKRKQNKKKIREKGKKRQKKFTRKRSLIVTKICQKKAKVKIKRMKAKFCLYSKATQVCS